MSPSTRASVFLFLLSVLISALVNAKPHPQFGNGNRHRHQVAPTSVVIVQQTEDGALPTNTLNDDTSTATAAPNREPIITDTPSTGTGGGKRGLAYNSSSPSLTVFANKDITWIHDWDASPGDAPSNFLFVPTLWSDKSPHSDNWDSLAQGHQYLMSFNEPDIVSQANMEVSYALGKYKDLMFPKRS
ncbi:MAG: hypothetical protein Q9222_005538, partial [Ikaeria aurantiellina]